MFKIFLLGRCFSPSPYLLFGSGLRSISLFYAELRIFEKRHTVRASVAAKNMRREEYNAGREMRCNMMAAREVRAVGKKSTNTSEKLTRSRRKTFTF